MKVEGETEKQIGLLTDIACFVGGSSGLSLVRLAGCSLRIIQNLDGKSITVRASQLESILHRSDVAGEDFIQVNFVTGAKILLTQKLIGYKPLKSQGLDGSRLPRVVTTPDVLNVLEAIYEALGSSGASSHEVSILKKIFESVIAGAELVGFDMKQERAWVSRIPQFRGLIQS